MGLLGKIKGFFNRQTDDGENVYRPDWEEESLKRDNIDMHDKIQREHYVKACMEQITEASKELDTLGGEYNLVTSYLTDMEEIEAQPDEVKEQLKTYASKILELENSREKLDKKRRIMKPEDYLRMERIEQYMPEGYKKLKEAEDYQILVKKDMGRLDGERHAYYYRKNELQNAMGNMKGITIMCVGSMLLLILMLTIIGSAWNLDVSLGYAIAVLIAASTLAFVYVKFHESQRELVKVEKGINKLVLLHNTVKIRYVNNTNLLEYLYVKYDVNSSNELKKLWDKYLEENIHREQEKQMEQDMDFNEAALIKLLRNCNIADPNVWLHQAAALIDSKEMVEIRHGLIIRRQKLRKQMEYNAKAAQEAQDEVKDIMAKYPEYAERILDLVSDYEKALA
ncbi:MAG: hypothetical protein K2G55_08115 [Lachnospiraceae bacterium]|nr:hypothetical protein [Lachnospiraceae bacterium]MDE7204991.1 hypothetical protein [Lachnospiraceae bacterium]